MSESPHLGGMGIPELYTDKHCSHLKLFLGHIKLKTDLGSQILLLISYIQLLVGSSSPLLSLSPSLYALWLEQIWITSTWEYASSLRKQVEVEQQWVPTSPHTGDTMLIDLVVRYHFTPEVLRSINKCSFFL